MAAVEEAAKPQEDGHALPATDLPVENADGAQEGIETSKLESDAAASAPKDAARDEAVQQEKEPAPDANGAQGEAPTLKSESDSAASAQKDAAGDDAVPDGKKVAQEANGEQLELAEVEKNGATEPAQPEDSTDVPAKDASNNQPDDPQKKDDSKLDQSEKKSTPHRNDGGRGRGSHRGAYQKDSRRNIKFDPSSLEISSDPDEIRKQVEFYFSDSNLPTDQFLLSQVGGTANNPVKIKVVHQFKRMRHFQPYTAVLAALKESKILEVTEDECVKRRVPLSKDLLGKTVQEGVRLLDDKTLPRSIYAKGFGQETPTTQFDIEAFFTPYGPYNAIRLRRTETRLFKGSVFVEFVDEATQKAFLALDPKPKWKGNDLLIKSKKEYVEGKAADIAAGRIRPGEKWKKNRDHNKRDQRDGAKGGDADDWKKRREEDQKRGFKTDQRGRGRDRGRGGRGQGRGQGRGGRGGSWAQTRDPHKVPEIKASAPAEPKERKEPASTTVAATGTSEASTTNIKPGSDLPSTSEPKKDASRLEEVAAKQVQAKQVEAKEKEGDKAIPPLAASTSAPAPAPAAGPAPAVADETSTNQESAHMDLDPTAGKKRARAADDDGTATGAAGDAGNPPSTKKVDTKSEAAVAE